MEEALRSSGCFLFTLCVPPELGYDQGSKVLGRGGMSTAVGHIILEMAKHRPS